MDFLYLLEGVRMPVLNEFFLAITQLGEETAFLVVAIIVFWCIDKYCGYYIMSVGFVGTLLNQFLKLTFRIPRPWVLDENFTILEQAREAASGYSFPSGHTQSSVGTFGALAYTTQSKWVRWTCIAIAVLVPFSRMYIGVHTPLDVFVSIGIALVLILLLKPFVLGHDSKRLPYVLGVILIIALAYLAYVELYPFPVDIDAHNLASGVKNAYTLLGALLGLLVAYIFDKKWLNFSTKAVWWAQILKVVFGLLIVLAVKSGLKSPINAIFGNSVGTAVRYFLIVLVAGAIWPMSFKWFSKFGNRK